MAVQSGEKTISQTDEYKAGRDAVDEEEVVSILTTGSIMSLHVVDQRRLSLKVKESTYKLLVTWGLSRRIITPGGFTEGTFQNT